MNGRRTPAAPDHLSAPRQGHDTMTPPDPQDILSAISYGVLGRTKTALAMLQPYVDAGPASTYGMLCVLAHAAQGDDDQGTPDTPVTIQIEGPGGQPASIDDLPPPLRFATRFIAACANRDHETSCALFAALAHHSDNNRTQDLAEAIGIVFDMAVATTAVKKNSGPQA